MDKLNPIIEFYGVYGTESALETRRGILRRLDNKIDALIKSSPLHQGYKLNNILKRLPEIGTTNLKEGSIDVPYDLGYLKALFEEFGKLYDNRDKLVELNKNLQALLPNIHVLFNYEELKDKDWFKRATKLLTPILAGYTAVGTKMVGTSVLFSVGAAAGMCAVYVLLAKLVFEINKYLVNINVTPEIKATIDRLIDSKELKNVEKIFNSIKINKLPEPMKVTLAGLPEKAEYINTLKAFVGKYKAELMQIDSYLNAVKSLEFITKANLSQLSLDESENSKFASNVELVENSNDVITSLVDVLIKLTSMLEKF